MHVHPRSIGAVAVTCPNSNVTLCRSSNDNYVPDLTFTIPCPIITSLTRSVSLLVLNKIGPHASYVPIPSCPFHGTSAPRCCRKGRNCRAPCCPRESACPPDSASAIKAYGPTSHAVPCGYFMLFLGRIKSQNQPEKRVNLSLITKSWFNQQLRGLKWHFAWFHAFQHWSCCLGWRELLRTSRSWFSTMIFFSKSFSLMAKSTSPELIGGAPWGSFSIFHVALHLNQAPAAVASGAFTLYRDHQGPVPLLPRHRRTPCT